MEIFFEYLHYNTIITNLFNLKILILKLNKLWRLAKRIQRANQFVK